MKKINNWIDTWVKQGAYLIAFLLCGAVYMTCADGWKAYAKPLAAVGSWWNDAKSVEAGSPDRQESLEEGTEGGSAGGDGAGSVLPDSGGGTGSVSGGDALGQLAVSGNDAAPVYCTPEEVVYATVEDDYFADAVFIGDSRTVGMFEYGGLEEISTFYASKGLTIYKLFDAPIVEVPGQKKKATIEEKLSEKQFSKIYLMLGINEMGSGTVETFLEKYKEAVEHLQELQPDAVIYVQGILKVTTARSEQGDYINNEGIEARNEGLAGLADNVKIYYLDANPLVCDETGGLESSYTYDGVHLKAQYIMIWKDFLKCHAVGVEEQLPGTAGYEE